MKKKILSAVAAVAALAPVAKSYARSDNANNFSSSEKVQQGDNKEALIENSITSIQQFMNSKIIDIRPRPIIKASADGDVTAMLRRSGSLVFVHAMRVGTNFKIDRQAFANWLKMEFMRTIDNYYNTTRSKLGVKLIELFLPSFISSRRAGVDMCAYVEKLKEQGLFKECIDKYVEEILDSEIEKAEMEVGEQEAKISIEDKVRAKSLGNVYYKNRDKLGQ